MAQGFAGEVAQFTQAEKSIVECRAEMDARLIKLRNEISATQVGWEGDASKAFFEIMARFDDASQRLNHALSGIGSLLEQAGSTYQASDQEKHQFLAAKTAGISSVLDNS